MTLINTGGTTLSGASVTISDIPGTYISLIVYIRNFRPATDGSSCYMRFNGDSNNRYNYGTTDTSNVTFAQDFISVVKDADDTVVTGITQIEIPDYANTVTWKQCHVYGHTPNMTTTTNYNRGWNYGLYNQTAAITSLTFYASSGNMTSGTVFVYGVK